MTFNFAQLDSRQVVWSGACGNMSAASGPVAIDQGLERSPRQQVV
ncbi:MAG: hypothetical protein HYY28_14740 [Betaproteobacteria bacterium]|nr:hypothetical protein [Betaproteobacteria bacterium]